MIQKNSLRILQRLNELFKLRDFNDKLHDILHMHQLHFLS